MSWLDARWAGIRGWLATVDWGDAPGWVGAVLTSGSLLLGLFILRHELRSSRVSEARKVVARYRILTTHNSTQLEVLAYNSNPYPMAVVTLLHWGGIIWHRKFFKNSAGQPDLAPGEEGKVEMPWSFPDYPRDKTALVEVTDSYGRQHYKGLESGQLYPRRTVKRWLKRGRWMRLKEKATAWKAGRAQRTNA